ncbi:MAG: hypothetical protein KDA60_21505, partial [Planctomycetales bacterium]|nr:hypothetical protein [Planctomycetales bacterium]
GDWLIAGAPLADRFGRANAGAAFVYHYDGVTWVEAAELTATNVDNAERFGDSVAISGKRIFVGAPLDRDGFRTGQGAVYEFIWDGMAWRHGAELFDAELTASARFGDAVALDGDSLLVGASTQDSSSGAIWAGAAFVFEWTGAVWVRSGYLEASDGTAFNRFGSAVALEGNLAVVGAYSKDAYGVPNQGAAYVFAKTNGTWSEATRLEPQTSEYVNYFGYDVAIDGGRVVVGAPRSNVGVRVWAGIAYVFEQYGSLWPQIAEVKREGSTGTPGLGSSVHIDGDEITLGIPRDDTIDTDTGAVQIFRLTADVPAQPGDADLNGVVDTEDYSSWLQNAFTQTQSWESGDFNADGVVDGQDFNRWFQFRFTSLTSPAASASSGTARLPRAPLAEESHVNVDAVFANLANDASHGNAEHLLRPHPFLQSRVVEGKTFSQRMPRRVLCEIRRARVIEPIGRQIPRENKHDSERFLSRLQLDWTGEDD